MYTCRGRLSNEVSRETKLAQGAEAPGLAHVIQLPAIDPKHHGQPNVLSRLIISALDNPEMPLGATHSVATPQPVHLARAQAKDAAARS
eukprot:7766926-Heterocapsa_arctica.AAC.1